ncbi:MAG: glycogen debranching enzyme N-terminal domain-containing protein [Deferribacteres bacterium]|nr:glycogen debranching enzyme N-terminal domain-containing protein [candidate division KSB1 bacterium]MCB9500738.1 glycogen debranching enzyme N-terminal domain-containing protein [Deferribacteres bacterium]
MLDKKWLLTNGLGGFCLDTLPGAHDVSRHLFYLPLKPPIHTQAILHRLHDAVSWQGNWEPICYSRPGEKLWEIKLDLKDGLPVYTCANPFFSIEKILFMIPGHNALFISYKLSQTSHEIAIRLRPSLYLPDGPEAFKDWRQVQESNEMGTVFHLSDNGGKKLFFQSDGAMEIIESRNWIYEENQESPTLYCPYAYTTFLQSNQPVTFRIGLDYDASFSGETLLKGEIDRREMIRLFAAKKTGNDLISSLAVSATNFVVEVATQKKRKNRVLVTHFPDPEIKISEILKSILGLYLCTGNTALSRNILQGLRQNAVNGVLQQVTDASENGFGAEDGLWYCNAVFTHWLVEKDDNFLADEYPFLLSILNAYLQNSVLGCHFDERDGLLIMDKCAHNLNNNGTIRWKTAQQSGKHVEIQALFYNALCIVLDIASRFNKKDGMRKLEDMHTSFRKNFLNLFWLSDQGHLAEYVNGNHIDKRFGASQLLALALPFSALTAKKAKSILDHAKNKLCTPFGVRTLDKSHPAYLGQKFNPQQHAELFENQGHLSLWATKLFVVASLKTGDKSENLIHLFTNLFEEAIKNGDSYFAEKRSGDHPYEPVDEGASITASASLMEVLYALRIDDQLKFDLSGGEKSEESES